MMKNIVINLSYIFLSQELGRNATFEEWVSTVESFDVGIGRMDMDPSHLDGVEVIPIDLALHTFFPRIELTKWIAFFPVF